MTPFEKAKERLEMRDREIASRHTLLEGSNTLTEAVLAYEGKIIREAMGLTNGSVTKAATLLGISYQRLGYILDTRHEGLRYKPKVSRESR